VGDGTLDASDLARLRTLTVEDIDAASSQLADLLGPLLELLPDTSVHQYSDNIGEALRSEPFWATGTGLDLVLDRVQFKLDVNGSLTVSVAGSSASITIDPAQNVANQLANAKSTFQTAVLDAKEALQLPPTMLAFDTQSSWGTAADSWAGFTGAATILPTKSYASPTIITFTSQALPAAGWWNVSASKDSGTGVYTLKLPEWSAGLTKNQLYSMGFNGNASAEAFEVAIKNATGCRINGDPCVITFGRTTNKDRGTLSTEDYLRTFGSFFAKDESLDAIKDSNAGAGTNTHQASNSPGGAGTQAHTNNGENGGLTQTADNGAETEGAGSCINPLYKVTVSSDGGGWSNGFGGVLTVENIGKCVIKNWSLTLPLESDAFSGLPSLWNGMASYSNGKLLIRPASWGSPDLAPGAVFTSGFNGGLARRWLHASSSGGVTLVHDKTLQATLDKQTSPAPAQPAVPVEPTVPTLPPVAALPVSPSSPPPAFGSAAELASEPWRKDPGNQPTISAKSDYPCNTVRWGDVDSVSESCLALMETHQFGGPKHTNANNQIELIDGKPPKEAFGYLVEWGVYGRKFGVENVAAAQYSKLIFSFVRLKPDGTLMITDDWASLQKDDTGTLLGIAADPFGNTWENQERGIMKRLTMLKARFPHLKTAFSVGGWTLSGQFSSVSADPVKRARFIKSSIDFANRFGFDGIDIDWEYPVVGGNLDTAMTGVNYAESNPGAESDAVNYVTLLNEFRQAIDSGTVNGSTVITARERTKSKKLMLSIAVGLGPKPIDAINYRDLVDSVDTINLMAYDFNGGWSSRVSHNAPLYDNQGYDTGKQFDQSEFNSHDAVLNLLWNLKYQGGNALRADGELGKARGHKNSNGPWTQEQREALLDDATLADYKAKMVLGMPFYGRGWASADPRPSTDVFAPWFEGSQATIGSMEKGMADTKDILYARDGQTARITQLSRASTWPVATIPANNFIWDRKACANFVWTGGHIFSFDDEDGIYHKAKYVKDRGLGGVMVWEVDGDTAEGALAKSFVLGMRGAAVNSRSMTPKVCDHR
jgi:GH18 family chitinase